MARTVLSCTVLLILLGHASAASLRQSKPLFPAQRRRMEEKSQAAAKAAEVKGDAAKEEKSDAAEQTEPAESAVPAEPAATQAVPAPPDVGSDGFPQLPAVSQMLGDASSTMNNVNSEANYLQNRVVQVQTQSASKMAKQKAAFEEKLKAQEEGNLAVIAQSAQISDAIAQLKKDNADLRSHAKDLQDTNKVMRTELHTLQLRLEAARNFATHSLSSTDDSKAPDLNVLQVAHTIKDDDSDDDSDDSDSDDESDGDADSFIAVSSRRAQFGNVGGRSDSFEAALAEMEAMTPTLSQQHSAPENPGDLLEQLSKEVAVLANQEKASAKKLKDLFVRDFRAGAKRHQALVVQQHALNSTRSSLLKTQKELQIADAHLENTRSQLQQRLQAVGHFMQKLAHLAMAPTKEVKHLLQSLPKAPAIPQSKTTQPKV